MTDTLAVLEQVLLTLGLAFIAMVVLKVFGAFDHADEVDLGVLWGMVLFFSFCLVLVGRSQSERQQPPKQRPPKQPSKRSPRTPSGTPGRDDGPSGFPDGDDGDDGGDGGE
jgi:hypothetical protein